MIILLAAVSLKKSFWVRSIHWIWVHSSLIFFPMARPILLIKLWERSMHLILVMLKMLRISYSNSSVIPFFLRDKDRMQGKLCIPSSNSFIPDLENRLSLNPERSILSREISSFESCIYFFFSPFLGGSPLGKCSLSTASLNEEGWARSISLDFSYTLSS